MTCDLKTNRPSSFPGKLCMATDLRLRRGIPKMRDWLSKTLRGRWALGLGAVVVTLGLASTAAINLVDGSSNHWVPMSERGYAQARVFARVSSGPVRNLSTVAVRRVSAMKLPAPLQQKGFR